MADVFPRRDLGAAEYWGRVVEDRLNAADKTLKQDKGFLSGTGRSNTSAQSDLAYNLQVLQQQVSQTQALVAALPASSSGASHVQNFGLSEGWQTVTSVTLSPPAGKTNLSVVAFGASKVYDPGAGGGSDPGGFRWPFPLSTVTSEYGIRDGRMHQGIDFGIREGTPIPASNAGTISGNGFGSGTGWYVDINHGNGIRTRNFHLVAQSDVAVGTQVEKGQTVGLVGNTGNSFGAHLHWETIVNGSHQNPRDFMAVYGDGGNSGGSGSTGAVFSQPRARIRINNVTSREFFPHRTLTPGATINYIYPQHGLNYPNSTVLVEFDLYSSTNLNPTDANFARLAVFGVFQP